MKIYLIFLLFIPTSLYASAWIPENGKYKIITGVDYTKFTRIQDHKNDPYLDYIILNYKLAIERGIHNKYSFLYTINTYKIIQYTYYIMDPLRGYQEQKYKRNMGFPSEFRSQEIAWKTKIFSNDLNIISHQIGIEKFSGSRYEFENKLMFGKTWKYKDQYHFFDGQISYRKGIKSFSDAVKVDLTLGLRYSEKRLYLVQLLNYFQTRLYDPYYKNVINTEKMYRESRLQLSTVYKVKDNISLQQGVYSNLNNRSKLKSAGIIFAIWFEL